MITKQTILDILQEFSQIPSNQSVYQKRGEQPKKDESHEKLHELARKLNKIFESQEKGGDSLLFALFLRIVLEHFTKEIKSNKQYLEARTSDLVKEIQSKIDKELPSAGSVMAFIVNQRNALTIFLKALGNPSYSSSLKSFIITLIDSDFEAFRQLFSTVNRFTQSLSDEEMLQLIEKYAGKIIQTFNAECLGKKNIVVNVKNLDEWFGKEILSKVECTWRAQAKMAEIIQQYFINKFSKEPTINSKIIVIVKENWREYASYEKLVESVKKDPKEKDILMVSIGIGVPFCAYISAGGEICQLHVGSETLLKVIHESALRLEEMKRKEESNQGRKRHLWAHLDITQQEKQKEILEKLTLSEIYPSKEKKEEKKEEKISQQILDKFKKCETNFEEFDKLFKNGQKAVVLNEFGFKEDLCFSLVNGHLGTLIELAITQVIKDKRNSIGVKDVLEWIVYTNGYLNSLSFSDQQQCVNSIEKKADFIQQSFLAEKIATMMVTYAQNKKPSEQEKHNFEHLMQLKLLLQIQGIKSAESYHEKMTGQKLDFQNFVFPPLPLEELKKSSNSSKPNPKPSLELNKPSSNPNNSSFFGSFFNIFKASTTNYEEMPRLSIKKKEEPKKEEPKFKIPEDYFCPVNLQVMKNPIILPDGHSMEKEAYELMIKNGSKCPTTRMEIPKNYVPIPNLTLKKSIVQFMEDNKTKIGQNCPADYEEYFGEEPHKLQLGL